jgi:hypothetical protein
VHEYKRIAAEQPSFKLHRSGKLPKHSSSARLPSAPKL